MQTIEILSPAGDWERLEAAVRFGADAVYLGGAQFDMRAAAAGFGPDELSRAVVYAHENDVNVYLVCNTLATNEETDRLPDFLKMAHSAGVDALIVADIGVMMAARRIVPKMALHVSTQAGVVNWRTAEELYRLGASRVVLARELSLEAIGAIRARTSPELELEAFVHGAMCMSVSGRCLLSSYLTGRDANRGECAQPCRWSYRLVEEKRPGQYFPIVEDAHGSYILNADDLCMIGHLDRLAEAGVTSFKIEGRAKSAYYTACVTAAYRAALDAYLAAPGAYSPPSWALGEVDKVSHRNYSTGFYFGTPGQNCETNGYVRGWDVIASVEGWAGGRLTVQERNVFSRGEQAELLVPRQAPRPLHIEEIFDVELGAPVERACHPMRRYELPCAGPVPPGSMLRRRAAQE